MKRVMDEMDMEDATAMKPATSETDGQSDEQMDREPGVAKTDPGTPMIKPENS